jgi:hypothetical protein
MTQWATALQGKAEPGPRGGLVFRWPGSFMRLAVEIDPVEEEGPIAIELATPRRLALTPGAHPTLNAVFRAVKA